MSFCTLQRQLRQLRLPSKAAFVPKRGFASKKPALPGPVVTSAWVAQNLASIRVLDASWFAPSMLEDPQFNFLNRRIPTASFFDIEKNSDKSTDLPHMLPKPDQFATFVGEQLGISNDDTVVIYDSKGVFSAPRVWFTFRALGAKNVAVLAGGLPQWRREGFPFVGGPAVQKWPAKKFEAKLNKDMVKTFNDVLENTKTQKVQVIDARSPGRFEGVEPEPRPGLRHGHIPGSVNLPWTNLLDDFTGLMKPTPILKSVFERAGVDLSDKEAPKIMSCGSGITACLLALGLNLLGHNKVAIYDGSWAEYGGRPEAPVDTGRAQPKTK